jgi:hypothetical protein
MTASERLPRLRGWKRGRMYGRVRSDVPVYESQQHLYSLAAKPC